MCAQIMLMYQINQNDVPMQCLVDKSKWYFNGMFDISDKSK